MGDVVGLTTKFLGDMAQLSELAPDAKATRRGEIYLAVASLYQMQASRLANHERALMRDILQRLTGDVEMAIRIALAEKLADDDNAPLELILLLADDHIEVARPVILRSHRLGDADLLTLLDHAGDAHMAACAERPEIGEPVCARLAQSDCEPVLVALVRNATARITAHTFEALVEKSRRISALQQPLVQRTDLPAPLATRMCDWVSDALRAHIQMSYPAMQATVQAKLAAAVETVQSGPGVAGGQPNPGSIKLINKLAAASQLKPAFLLRVLHQGQFDLFDLGFATLLGLELGQLRRIVYDEGIRQAALACRAVGIDRCVFPTVFALSRQSRGYDPMLSLHDKRDAEAIFEAFTKAEALLRVKKLATRELSSPHVDGR